MPARNLAGLIEKTRESPPNPLRAAWAAASRAIGTRKGEQET
jgi:hypothetical protein